MPARPMRIGRRIQDRRIALRWKQKHLVAALEKVGRKTSVQSVSQWENDERRTWTDSDVNKLAQALGVPIDYFTTQSGYTLDELRRDIVERPNLALPLIDLLTLVEAGMDAAISGAIEAGQYHQTNFKVPRGFSMPVPDDSMEPMLRKKRSIVSIARGMEPAEGDIVLVKIGDALFLRVVSFGDKRVKLTPHNKKWAAMSLKPSEWKKAEVLGVMVAVETQVREIPQGN